MKMAGAQSRASAICLRQWLARQAIENVRPGVKGNMKKSKKTTGLGEFDDFVVSDEDEGDFFGQGPDWIPDRDGLTGSPNLNGGHSNVLLLSGPVGSGKTSAIHAVAEELGWNVLEMNAGGRRSGKDVERLVGNLGQNHTVTALNASLSTTQGIAAVFGPGQANAHASDRTLILLEEVDILFRDDKDFWSGVFN
ncbi:hypothetical protein OIV83_006096 [Microbotryomycetes sp. JL201]|nr:hypothetical protein OIV83_006096 [Microbotryomycetes sp. JL201]